MGLYHSMIMYMMIMKFVYLNFLNLLQMRMVKIEMFSLRRLKVFQSHASVEDSARSDRITTLRVSGLLI